jgi:hypothetical protein
MGKIIATTFVTLDGVVQALRGPSEDTTGGFKYGGWSVNYWDETMGTEDQKRDATSFLDS